MLTEKLIKAYNLGNYIKNIISNNTSNDAPYHNLYHLCCVANYAHIIAISEKLEPVDVKNLLIAGLFHDFNHSQGKLKDSENVKNAIESFLKYSNESNENNTKIIDIISATEYPYVIEESNLNISQMIIRDADLMQILQDNWFEQVILGLSKEMNLNLKDAIEKFSYFCRNIKYITKTGNLIGKDALLTRVYELENLNNLL